MQIVADKMLSAPDEALDELWYCLADDDITVRLWASLAYGSYSGARPSDFIAEAIQKRDWNDSWMQTAALSGAESNALTIFLSIIEQGDENGAELLQKSLSVSGRFWLKHPKVIDVVLSTLRELYAANSSALAAAGMRGLAKALAIASKSLDELNLTSEDRTWLEKMIAEAAQAALSSNHSIEHRIQAMSIVVIGSFSAYSSAWTALLAPTQPAELQLAALEALGSYREPAVADMLIDAWSTMTPALRDKATTILLSRTDRIAKLLDAIEVKKITPSQLSVAAKATLGRQKTPALAERIAKLIGDGSSSNRKAVIETYLTAMQGSDAGTPARKESVVAGKSARITGDATRGAKVYEMACMVCHKFAEKGNDVGPHLGTIKAWTVEQLVTNILDPNREVSPNFALYLVETKDGRTLSGLITSETAGNLTLKRADGGTDTVLRSEIQSLTSPGISLMPEGLEAAITPQQMADLIAYLKADG